MNAPRTRVQRRPVHGVLLLDKPLGLSSNQALQKAKWLLRAEKAGHTGTLDPLATGVLPLCFGAATKFSQLHLDADKTYEATARLGIRTSTGDAEGDVIEERPVAVTPDYAHAKVFFSLLVGDPVETTEALNQAAGFLRNGLFKRLHIHTVPTLHFQFDRTTERAADMNALIAQAVASRSKDD